MWKMSGTKVQHTHHTHETTVNNNSDNDEDDGDVAETNYFICGGQYVFDTFN